MGIQKQEFLDAFQQNLEYTFFEHCASIGSCSLGAVAVVGDTDPHDDKTLTCMIIFSCRENCPVTGAKFDILKNLAARITITQLGLDDEIEP